MHDRTTLYLPDHPDKHVLRSSEGIWVYLPHRTTLIVRANGTAEIHNPHPDNEEFVIAILGQLTGYQVIER